METEIDGNTLCNWWARYSNQTLVQVLDDLEIRGRLETIQTRALLRSARILRRILGVLRRLAMIQIPVKKHYLQLGWKLAAEWRSYKLQHFWKRPEYWEESWWREETCCHSISSERPSAYADVKTLMSNNNNNNNKNNIFYCCRCSYSSFFYFIVLSLL